MANKKKKVPDFFEENPFDPVNAATGKGPSFDTDNKGSKDSGKANKKNVEKKKAGFYISSQLLDRFNRKFFELKLADIDIGNKSILVEAALVFALDDMDKGKKSLVLKKLSG
ncbi:MAG: hypothetical protein HN931_09465 [Desulfobacterales bacterium]|nr:hypothetical protein [Desulfobacterales bacterium]